MTSQTETLTPTSALEADAARARVVLVDARADRRSVMRQMFEHSGVAATVVGEADGHVDAIALVEQHRADLAILDLPLPVRDGLETVSALRHRFPDLAIVVSTFNTDAATKEKALADGANAYLVKPVSAREVMAAMASTRRTGDAG